MHLFHVPRPRLRLHSRNGSQARSGGDFDGTVSRGRWLRQDERMTGVVVHRRHRGSKERRLRMETQCRQHPSLRRATWVATWRVRQSSGWLTGPSPETSCGRSDDVAKDNPDHRCKILDWFCGQRSDFVAVLWISVSLLTLTIIDWSLGTFLP